MNSREPIRPPHPPGTGRAARLRRRKRKRIALFASFLVIILIITLAVVLLALEIADASGKLKSAADDTTSLPSDTSAPSINTDYVAASGSFSVNEGVLLLVNSEHEYVFPAVESRLVNVFDSREKNSAGEYYYQCSFNTIRMDKTALAALNGLMAAFSEATNNKDVLVSDAYRSYSEQEGKDIKPGFSDHHTGYLVSIKFYDGTRTYTSDNSSVYSDAYAWINEHAAEHGFVLRYPNSKASVTGVSDYTYCYRYVGTAHAAYMSANNLCLEDYITLLKTSHTYGKNHLSITDAAGAGYEIYYVPKTGDNTTIYVPASSRGYEISGDNDGGYIVTVKLD